MTAAATLRAMQLADSAFPSGAFAFSNGLETRAAEGLLDTPGLEAFLAAQIGPRWLGFDRWFLAQAHGADDEAARDALDRGCEARQTVAALASASRRQGRALLTSHARAGVAGAGDYLAAVKAGDVPGHAAIVQGWAARAIGLPLALAEAAALHGVLAAAASAAVRLGAIGALEAQALVARVAARLAPALDAPRPARPSAFAPLADIATCRSPGPAARLFAT